MPLSVIRKARHLRLRATSNSANVEVGQAIVRLHDMSEVRVEIDVPERLLQQIANTQQVWFSG